MTISAVWIDLILGGVLLEALALWFWLAKSSRRVIRMPLLINLVAGACLLFALRSALLSQQTAILLALACALVAHLLDLLLRLRHQERRD